MAAAQVDHFLATGRGFSRRRARIGKDGATIGRGSACDLRLRFPSAPLRAARVERKADGYYLVALSPDVDLRVAGKRVLQAKLMEGDVIEVAGERVRYLRAMRSRVVLIPVLSLLVVALVTLSIAYRYSDRYYRNLALNEFHKGNQQALEQYIERGIVGNAEAVLADKEVMDAADQIFPEAPKTAPIQEQTFEDLVKKSLRGFGVRDPQVDEWALSRVQRWVDLYTGNRAFRHYATLALGRSTAVSDTIIRKLRASVMPEYLIFLAFAESNFSTTIESPVGAQGLWQFMPGTAQRFGLSDRTDPAAATDAAIAYLRELTALWGPDSILMAMASYNCGEGGVMRCLRRAVADPYAERTFWHLSRTGCLPEETQEYVPKILALSVIGTQPERFDLPIPPGYQLNQLKPKIPDDTMPAGPAAPKAPAPTTAPAAAPTPTGNSAWTSTPSAPPASEPAAK